MTFFTKLLLVTTITVAICSSIASVAIYFFCLPPVDRFVEWMLQAISIVVFGLVLQNFAHLKWLQRETVIQRWSPGDTQDFLYRTLVELIQFPYKSVLLATALWIILGMPAAALYWLTIDNSIGNALVVYSFLLATGSSVAFVQDFFCRRQLYPRLEEFLEMQSESLQRRLAEAQMPFSVRAKLILQSSFALIVIVMVTLSAGYAIERNRLRAEEQRFITDLLSMVEPVIAENRYGEKKEDLDSLLQMIARMLEGGVAISFDGQRIEHVMGSESPELRTLLTGAVRGSGSELSNWLVVQRDFSQFSVAAAQPWDDYGGDLAYYLYLFIFSFTGGCLLIFFIAFLASHDISRSVRRIEKWSEMLGAGELDYSPPVTEDDQVADLIFRLDSLKNRLALLLDQMQAGAVGTRAISSRVQEHAVLLRQTTEEDSNLISLTSSLLEKMRITLQEHQKTVARLSHNTEEAVSSTTQMIPILKEVDNRSAALADIVSDYRGATENLEQLIVICRDDLSAFVVGAEEAKRSIHNLDDVLDHLIETIRRSKQAVQRTANQSGTTFDSTHRTRMEVQQLEETMSDSSVLLVHLAETMGELKTVASSIHEVAEDTKLLSLNAAIRSAKAQEEGRSFSVISHTIQDLAVETQSAIHLLLSQIEGLMNESGELDEHVSALSESLSAALTEGSKGADLWRQTRSSVQIFDKLEVQFEQFVQDLRHYRDEVRMRQGRFESQTRVISQLLSDLVNVLEQRRQQINDIQDRSDQIRNYASYEVAKGRYASDHLEQIRAMSVHVQSFLVDQVRSVTEIEQSLVHLESGSKTNVQEARDISDGLKRLERAIRHFEDAFSQFRVRPLGQGSP